jgi:prepilin-type N-terminal cleavage/methylation domain-containing protein
MSTASRRRRGFSLIEAMVAVAVTGIGVTAALGGMRALAKAEHRATRTEIMQRLAFQKYDEVIATGEVNTAPLEGDFRDVNVDGYEWRVEVEQSGVENLSIVKVRVNPAGEEDNYVLAKGLQFQPPPPTQEGGGQ